MRNDLAENLADENVERRLRAGIVTLFVALVLAVFFEQTGASSLARLSLFFPFFFSANSFFQGLYKTCGFAALSGCRQSEHGSERIADPVELRAVRERGRKQIALSAVAALTLTLTFVVTA